MLIISNTTSTRQRRIMITESFKARFISQTHHQPRNHLASHLSSRPDGYKNTLKPSHFPTIQTNPIQYYQTNIPSNQFKVPQPCHPSTPNSKAGSRTTASSPKRIQRPQQWIRYAPQPSPAAAPSSSVRYSPFPPLSSGILEQQPIIRVCPR